MLDSRFFNQRPVLKDGNSEIIFSGVFCLNQNKLIIEGIARFTLEFEFKNDSNRGNGEFLTEVVGEKLKIYMFNFRNPLGNTTKEPVPLLNIADDPALGSGQIYMAFKVRTMEQSVSIIEFTLTLTYSRNAHA